MADSSDVDKRSADAKLPTSDSSHSPGRRAFLRRASVATAATLTAPALGLDSLLASKAFAAPPAHKRKSPHTSHGSGERRRDEAFRIRTDAAQAEKQVPIPDHEDNGDEALYLNRIGNFSKALPHNSIGEVDPGAYSSLLDALNSGDPADFDAIPLGGTLKLTNPQSGLAFDLEGTDSHQLAIPPAPALAGAQRAGEAVEVYWQAILRDVPFAQYGTSMLAQDAIDDLNNLSDFRGPSESNHVTARTLFRGFTAGDLLGPYVSQFFYPVPQFGVLPYGAAQITQQFQTYAAGVDYLTDFASWLKAQRGQGPFSSNQADPTPRYIRDGRDLAAWVHVDVLFQAYFDAVLYLLASGAPLNPANPYASSKNQAGFGTFGAPHISALVCEVATRALKAIWYEKWFVHRALRPEEYGGLVHNTLAGVKPYPLHSDVLTSHAVQQVFTHNGSYLLPQAFPEGCPTHPSYGAGHATVAGACVTIIKAFFDETFVLPNPVVPSDDGLSLNPYTGANAGQLTVGGELDKLAANIAIARNFAGIHWRSDYEESLKLGEKVAIAVLRDQRACYNETFSGFTFTAFDGTKITV